MTTFEWFLFWTSTLSLTIISMTMLARANDLRWRKGLHWNIRLIGFVMAGVAPIGIVIYEFTMLQPPTPYNTIFRLGVAFVFLTTPYLPPWAKWVFGANYGDVVYSDDRRGPPK